MQESEKSSPEADSPGSPLDFGLDNAKYWEICTVYDLGLQLVIVWRLLGPRGPGY